jgi:hypothetical protein
LERTSDPAPRSSDGDVKDGRSKYADDVHSDALTMFSMLKTPVIVAGASVSESRGRRAAPQRGNTGGSRLGIAVSHRMPQAAFGAADRSRLRRTAYHHALRSPASFRSALPMSVPGL